LQLAVHINNVCSKRPVFSTEAYASDMRFFETLQG